MSISNHGIGVKSDGFAWSWGGNANGQLGDLTITGKSSPILVVGVHSFVSIRTGGSGQFNSAGIKENGECWIWGVAPVNQGTWGKLGDNTIVSKSSPVLVVGSHAFVDVCVDGLYHSVGVKTDGTVWCWGRNNIGQLGTNNLTSRSSPVAVVGGITGFVQAVAFGTFSGALRATDGSVWTWGDNSNGILGANLAATRVSSPVLVVGSHSFTQITNTNGNTFALKANGEVWGWGANSTGGLADGSVTTRSSPVKVVGSHSFIQIRGGGLFMAALKADGSVWCWGRNAEGECADGTITVRSSPVAVVGSHSFIELGNMGNSFGYALKANGEVWSWGDATNGQLGNNTTTPNVSSPVLVVGSHSFNFVYNKPATVDDESSSSSSSVSSASSPSSQSDDNSSSSVSSLSSASSVSSASSLSSVSSSSVSSVSSVSSLSSESSSVSSVSSVSSASSLSSESSSISSQSSASSASSLSSESSSVSSFSSVSSVSSVSSLSSESSSVSSLSSVSSQSSVSSESSSLSSESSPSSQSSVSSESSSLSSASSLSSLSSESSSISSVSSASSSSSSSLSSVSSSQSSSSVVEDGLIRAIEVATIDWYAGINGGSLQASCPLYGDVGGIDRGLPFATYALVGSSFSATTCSDLAMAMVQVSIHDAKLELYAPSLEADAILDGVGSWATAGSTVTFDVSPFGVVRLSEPHGHGRSIHVSILARLERPR